MPRTLFLEGRAVSSEAEPDNTKKITAGAWREEWAPRVCTPEDLVGFVEAVGCCTNGALPGYPDFPHVDAVMGKVDPAAADPWFWKDDLHIEKRLWYTRVFRGRPGYISNELLPAVIATNGAAVDELLSLGVLSPEAQEVYRTIEAAGPLSTKRLKPVLTPPAARAASRVLIELDRMFLITKSGITGRTRGTYSYVWDLVERWAPDMLAAADRLGRDDGEAMLRDHLAGFGVPPDADFYAKVLRWGR